MRNKVIGVVALAGLVGGAWLLASRPEPHVAPIAVLPTPAPRARPPGPECLLGFMVNEGEFKTARDEPDAGDFAWQPWLGPIGIAFVCDRGEGQATWLSRAELEGIPLDGGTIEQVMLANLERRIGGLQFAPVRDTGVGTNATDDSYAASLLLLEGPWLDMDRSEGDIVVAAPGRGKIFVAPRGPEFEKPLRELAAKAFQVEPDPLYEGVIVRRDGGWELLP